MKPIEVKVYTDSFVTVQGDLGKRKTHYLIQISGDFGYVLDDTNRIQAVLLKNVEVIDLDPIIEIIPLNEYLEKHGIKQEEKIPEIPQDTQSATGMQERDTASFRKFEVKNNDGKPNQTVDFKENVKPPVIEVDDGKPKTETKDFEKNKEEVPDKDRDESKDREESIEEAQERLDERKELEKINEGKELATSGVE